MTFASGAQQMGKTAIQILELHLDRCPLSYGTAPCVAAVGVTGPQKCYNARATCQDPANYAAGSCVYRFSNIRIDNVQQPGDAPTFPTLLQAAVAPTVLTPGSGLGVRATLSATIVDHPWTDAGTDPYLSGRAFNPDTVGSFWGRFVARNKYYQNRRVDILSGFLEADGSVIYANLRRRSYILARISGPGPDGRVTVEGTDPLRLTDGEKAKQPAASTATLVGDINASVTTLEAQDTNGSLQAWWDSGNRYFRIKEEIMMAGAYAVDGSHVVTLSGITRASMPAFYDAPQNVAADHSDGETVQGCILYEDYPANVVYDLLYRVAGIPSAYLPVYDWIDNFYSYSYMFFRTLICEPVDVKTLLDEIAKLGILIYWDELANVVQVKPLTFRQLIRTPLTDGVNIVKDSLAVSEDVKALITQWWLYFAIGYPLANKDLLVSYRVVDIAANLAKETDAEYKYPSICQIKSRWLPLDAVSVARNIAALMIRQYSEVRKAIAFTLDPKDATFWVGDTIGVSSKYVQDFYGNPSVRNYLVTQMEETVTAQGMRFKVAAAEQFAFSRLGVIAPNSPATTYTPSRVDDKNHYAFIGYNQPPAVPLFPDGSEAYQIE